jgi:hypothetical protein
MNDQLNKIEELMVRRIEFAKKSKQMAGSTTSKQREHYRMHALSEALGEIRKVIKEKSA